MKYLRDRFYQQGFRQPGRTRDQAMSARKQCDEDLFNHALLANDDFLQLGLDARASRNELLHQFLFRILHIFLRIN